MKTFTILILLALTIPVHAREERNDTLKGKFKKIWLQEKRDSQRVQMPCVLRDTHHQNNCNSNSPSFIDQWSHWSGFSFGFVNFTNTDYTKYDGNEFMELDWGNSFVMQFNLISKSLCVNKKNNLGYVTGLGLEYQRLRFAHKNSVELDEDGKVEPLPLAELHVKKNSFKNLYLTIPMLFEFQFPAKFHRPFYIEAGLLVGFRLHTKTKVVHKNDSGHLCRIKHSGSFGMVPCKTDAVIRIGCGPIGIWGSYTMNRMLQSDKGPELHPYAIGVFLHLAN